MSKNTTKEQQPGEEMKQDTATVEQTAAKETKRTTNKSGKIAEAEKKIDELTDKLSREHDDYIRLMAEFETFRRRSAEERVKLIDTAASDTIKGLLPVLDDCERAIKMLENSSDEAAKQGTSLIYDKLFGYLKGCGLEPIKAVGETFDVDFHEAVTQFPAPTEDMKGKVVDVIQTGYTLHGKVLRYAKVVVGA